jgi:antitoxin PrlF
LFINGIPDGEGIRVSKVTAKYQITIPREVREKLGIVPGAEVDIAKEGKKYVLVVDPARAVQRKWRGKFKNGVSTMEYMNQVRGEVN